MRYSTASSIDSMSAAPSEHQGKHTAKDKEQKDHSSK